MDRSNPFLGFGSLPVGVESRPRLGRRSHWIDLAAIGLAMFAGLSVRVYGQGTVTTDDGLALSLSSTGAVSALKINGTNYGSSLPSGFFYRESTASMPNWVSNGSFESGSGSPTNWTISGGDAGTTWSIDATNSSAGSRSMKLSIPGSTGMRSPDLTSIAIPLKPNTPYVLTGSFKASGAGGSGLGMYLLEQDQNGTVQRNVSTPVGTHDWVTRTITFTSSPSTIQAYIKINVSGGYGTNWVDDFRLSDPFGGDTPIAFGGTVSSSGGVVTQSASRDGLSLIAHFTSVGTAIKVDGTLTDTTGADRGVELTYRLPLDIAGWIWDEDFVTPQTIASGTRYDNIEMAFAGSTRGHTHSTYPFATVRNSSAAFSLAVPMGPLMDRFTYDDSYGFCVTHDLGLSPAASTPSKANFSFWIYTHNPKWGMRSAASRYYALNPANFTTSATVLGAWALRSTQPLSSVPNPQDFGWGYEEGRSELDFDNANGIVGLNYLSAPQWSIHISGYSSQPPYDVLIAKLTDALAASGSTDDGTPTAAMAAAVIASSPYDQNGLYQLSYNGYFWYSNILQMYPVVQYSTLPGGPYGLRTQYSVDNQIANAEAAGNTLGGIFLDNTTNAFANIENYRQEFWAYNIRPLSFSYRTGKTVQYTGDGMAEFLEAFQDYVHSKGLVLMASGPIYAWFAPYIDVLGGECRGAMLLDRAYAQRTMGYGKVLTNLFVPLTQDPPPAAANVLAYLRQGLLLGYFPGFNGKYWNSPTSYERDRTLFQQYTPLIKTIAQAGWRPVNYATSSNTTTLIERFGTPASGSFYVTAQNSSTSPTSVQLTLDGSGLGIASSTPVTVQELLTNTSRTVTRNGTNIIFPDTLDAGETALYLVTAVVVAPVADFTFAPSSATPGQTIQFTDTSTNGPTSWSWTFGDGGTSTAQNPTHSFAAEGSYTVTLVAANSAGSDSITHTVTISVDTPSVASISPSSGPAATGTNVIIMGTNFQSGAAVKIGGVSATNVSVVNSTKITGKTPQLLAGSLSDVKVTNPGNMSGTLTKGWLADFLDVPQSNVFHDDIEKVFRDGISVGCGVGIYCPAVAVLRSQMAVFLLKAEHGPSYVPPACTGVFPDVPCPSQFANWIERLAAEGITSGCGGGLYCPTAPVSRAQMAVFLLKTEHGASYVPPGCSGIFGDVACPSQYANWIEQLYAEEVTAGCGNGNYCPNAATPRGQMATFLVKTFSLP